MNERCRTAMTLIMELHTDSAQVLIDQERVENPKNHIVDYLENSVDFLTVVLTEDEVQFNAREEAKNQRMKRIESCPDSDPYRKFILAEINLQWAFSRLRFGEYLKGAREINRAFKLLEKNIEKHPDFLPNYKAMGLLHALIGTVPDKYRWATDLMGIDGTINQGLGELQRVIEECPKKPKYAFLEIESIFLYSFIVLNLTPDTKPLKAIESQFELLAQKSPLVAFAKASLLADLGETKVAIVLLENSGYQNRPIRFYYLDLLLGNYRLSSMERKCERNFQFYVDHFPGKSYMKSAQLKLAWHRLLFFNSEEQFTKRLAKIDSIGSNMLDEDKQAQRAFEDGGIPNTGLLRARLLFDGGFYNEARTALHDSKPTLKTDVDFQEHRYRLARTDHESGNLDQAIISYKTVAAESPVNRSYFPANSALKLGKIFELTNENTEALKWYRKALTYQDHQYQNSIHQKAKAAISRLGG